MKIFFSQVNTNSEMIEEDLAPLDLKESIRKTRQALDIAYAGFDNAIESDLTVISMKLMLCRNGISTSPNSPLPSLCGRKKLYTSIPRFEPWSAMFSVN